jgi:uncharacterized protein
MESTEKLRVVLDTNIILNAFSKRLPYRHLLQSLLQGKYQLYITTEILLEYEEKIAEFYNSNTANTFLDALTISTNVYQVNPHFRFNFLQDLDDNKFVDCAFAANTHFIVSDDRGFKLLKTIEFPKIEVLSLEDFSQLLIQL